MKLSLLPTRSYADAARQGAGRRLVSAGTQYSFADAHPAQPPRKQLLAAPPIQISDVNLSNTSGTTQTPERESLPHDKPSTACEPALEAMEVTTGTPESVTLRDSPKGRRISQDRLKQQKKHPPVMPPSTGDDT
ncbi:hypothetical protein HPB50_005104 [Hyalomma asiaticum]|uniref:Uncharacterized protein n=1 Tax=Hyalomma asiaticum TaxID=266040 RepID=A0ACB7SF84_HYAAI|nr:hypothetical protein HPB50_005104 [Hyalomma asiaticum]